MKNYKETIPFYTIEVVNTDEDKWTQLSIGVWDAIAVATLARTAGNVLSIEVVDQHTGEVMMFFTEDTQKAHNNFESDDWKQAVEELCRYKDEKEEF